MLVERARATRARSAHRRRRQIRRACRTPTRSLYESLDHAGIAHTRRGRQDSSGSKPKRSRTRRGRRSCDRLRRRAGAGRLRRARHRGQDRGDPLRARAAKVPFFGICLGMQCAVIEFARNVCGLEDANCTEFDPSTPHPVICCCDEQNGDRHRSGGTMRLGAYPCELAEGARARRRITASRSCHERHRHRYEFNNHYRRRSSSNGLIVSGTFARRPAGRDHRARRTTRGSWRCSSIRSSSRSRRGRPRCSATSSAPPSCARANGPRSAQPPLKRPT